MSHNSDDVLSYLTLQILPLEDEMARIVSSVIVRMRELDPEAADGVPDVVIAMSVLQDIGESVLVKVMAQLPVAQAVDDILHADDPEDFQHSLAQFEQMIAQTVSGDTDLDPGTFDAPRRLM
jgi:hypothetical protein